MFSQSEKIEFMRQFEQAVKLYDEALEKFPRDGTWNSPCVEERCLGCANDCLKVRNVNRLNYMINQVTDEMWAEWSVNPLIALIVNPKV
jgi:hypothetical protein